MNILYSLNENYAKHLAASLCSLCENNKSSPSITFYIISCGISDISKEKIKNLAERYGRDAVFFEIGDVRDAIEGELDTKGFDVSVLARLLVGRYLTCDSVERILYLDCDTIVIDDISEFYNTDMENFILAGVPEPVVTKSRRPVLGMAACDDYYNSGVLLFNMKLWREQRCEERVLSYFLENMDKLVATDQDAINACFVGRIKSVAPKYNFGSYNFYYPYKLLKKLSGAAPYVTKEAYEDSKKHPAIIHYLGEERPWRAGNTHPQKAEYKRYLALTDWKDEPDEKGWRLYFLCFRIFNFVTKPFPSVRYKVIDSLIPAFMRKRAKKLKKQKRQ